MHACNCSILQNAEDRWGWQQSPCGYNWQQWRQQQYKQAAQRNNSSVVVVVVERLEANKEKYNIGNQLAIRASALGYIKSMATQANSKSLLA